jgi:hypothetical protein
MQAQGLALYTYPLKPVFKGFPWRGSPQNPFSGLSAAKNKKRKK